MRILIIFISSFFIFFCNCKRTNFTIENEVHLEFLPSLKIKENVISLINEYISEYSQFDNFLLVCSPIKPVEAKEYFNYLNRDFILGPAYENTFSEHSPVLYFEINNKRIFIKNGLEELFDYPKNNTIYNLSQIPREKDSIRIEETNWILKNGEIIYLYRAIYFSIDKEDKIEINTRPDTLFLPEIKNANFSFENSK